MYWTEQRVQKSWTESVMIFCTEALLISSVFLFLVIVSAFSYSPDGNNGLTFLKFENAVAESSRTNQPAQASEQVEVSHVTR